jgi:xylose isomerase
MEMSLKVREYFKFIDSIKYEGSDSKNPFAYRFYNPEQIVLGKSMEEHLRISVCLWHTFCGSGNDMFGDSTFCRAWNYSNNPSDIMEMAEQRIDAAFEFVSKLNVPFISFHDADITPPASNLKEFVNLYSRAIDYVQKKMGQTGIGLLLGTSNLFSDPCFAAGVATNPDPDVFAYAAAKVKSAMDGVNRLNGQNYVLWGGREGYDTLLNTDLNREIEQLGRFVSMVVEYKYKIGFKGALLIEPKPCEPAKHQYDYDVATVYGFLKKFGLEKEVQVNLEANHATLASHSFEHEVAYACALGIIGSIDANRGDYQNGWDTDQFPHDIRELSLVMARLISHGGFEKGGFNFDAKLRRQSVNLEDLFYAHIGGIDVLAKSLLIAEQLIRDNILASITEKRYEQWNNELGKSILHEKIGLDELSKYVLDNNISPYPKSGHQELYENMINYYIL